MSQLVSAFMEESNPLTIGLIWDVQHTIIAIDLITHHKTECSQFDFFGISQDGTELNNLIVLQSFANSKVPFFHQLLARKLNNRK